jgi:hypothetical protein
MQLNALGPNNWGPNKAALWPRASPVIKTTTFPINLPPRTDFNEWRSSTKVHTKSIKAMTVNLPDRNSRHSPHLIDRREPYVAFPLFCMSTHDVQRGYSRTSVSLQVLDTPLRGDQL